MGNRPQNIQSRAKRTRAIVDVTVVHWLRLLSAEYVYQTGSEQSCSDSVVPNQNNVTSYAGFRGTSPTSATNVSPASGLSRIAGCEQQLAALPCILDSMCARELKLGPIGRRAQVKVRAGDQGKSERLGLPLVHWRYASALTCPF